MQNFFPDGRQDRDDTLFIALAADFECGIVAREIVAVDTYEFRKPQSATVKQENDERISDKFEFRTFSRSSSSRIPSMRVEGTNAGIRREVFSAWMRYMTSLSIRPVRWR